MAEASSDLVHWCLNSATAMAKQRRTTRREKMESEDDQGERLHRHGDSNNRLWTQTTRHPLPRLVDVERQLRATIQRRWMGGSVDAKLRTKMRKRSRRTKRWLQLRHPERAAQDLTRGPSTRRHNRLHQPRFIGSQPNSSNNRQVYSHHSLFNSSRLCRPWIDLSLSLPLLPSRRLWQLLRFGRNLHPNLPSRHSTLLSLSQSVRRRPKHRVTGVCLNLMTSHTYCAHLDPTGLGSRPTWGPRPLLWSKTTLSARRIKERLNGRRLFKTPIGRRRAARSCLILLNHHREVVGEDTTTRLPRLDLLPLLLVSNFTTKPLKLPRWRRLPRPLEASRSPTMAFPSPRLLCSNLLFSHQHSPWRYNNILLPSLSLRQCHLAHGLCEHLSGSLDSPSESVNKASECRFHQRHHLVLRLQSHESGLWLRHSRLYSRREPMPSLSNSNNNTTLKLSGRRRKCSRCVSGRRENEKENERGREKWRANQSGRRCGLSKSRKLPLHRTITSSLAIDSKEVLVVSLSQDHHRKSQVDLRRMLLHLCSNHHPNSNLLRSR